VLTKTQKDVLNASNQFGFNLFKDMAATGAADENLFISPLSISFALTMTYNGAANQTAADMQKTLDYGNMSTETINQSCKELMQTITTLDPNVAMEIANSIWYRNTFPVKDTFLTINRTYFDAEVEPADFTNPQTTDIINNWVATKTHDKITSVIDGIPSEAIMYLINAIYFKGTWKYRFETKNTIEAPFYLTDGNTYQTDFMNLKDKFRYMKNDLFSAVELPYGNGGFSMLVLLPNEGKTYTDVVSNLTSDNWAQWNSNLDTATVFVKLPKFKFSYEKKLNQNLTNLGMGIAFDQDNADFSGINETAQLYISFVLHKSFVDVNEEGTEAAAVTVVGIFTTSSPDGPGYKDFNVNKPFVFAIKENTSNSILFMGLVKKPVVE
jgi:serpin B